MGMEKLSGLKPLREQILKTETLARADPTSNEITHTPGGEIDLNALRERLFSPDPSTGPAIDTQTTVEQLPEITPWERNLNAMIQLFQGELFNQPNRYANVPEDLINKVILTIQQHTTATIDGRYNYVGDPAAFTENLRAKREQLLKETVSEERKKHIVDLFSKFILNE